MFVMTYKMEVNLAIWLNLCINYRIWYDVPGLVWQLPISCCVISLYKPSQFIIVHSWLRSDQTGNDMFFVLHNFLKLHQLVFFVLSMIGQVTLASAIPFTVVCALYWQIKSALLSRATLTILFDQTYIVVKISCDHCDLIFLCITLANKILNSYT